MLRYTVLEALKVGQLICDDSGYKNDVMFS